MLPATVAIGDFNADGRPDLATANDQSQDVSILLGTGTGAFGASTNFPAGPSPRSATLRDLNADGRLDVVVANLGGNTASGLLTTRHLRPHHQHAPHVPVDPRRQPRDVHRRRQRQRHLPVAGPNGINLSDVGEIAGSDRHLDILPSLLGDHNSAFDCVVTNACGSTTSCRGQPRPPRPADVDDGSNTGTRDNGVDINDLLYFLFHFEVGNAQLEAEISSSVTG